MTKERMFIDLSDSDFTYIVTIGANNYITGVRQYENNRLEYVLYDENESKYSEYPEKYSQQKDLIEALTHVYERCDAQAVHARLYEFVEDKSEVLMAICNTDELKDIIYDHLSEVKYLRNKIKEYETLDHFVTIVEEHDDKADMPMFDSKDIFTNTFRDGTTVTYAQDINGDIVEISRTMFVKMPKPVDHIYLDFDFKGETT